VTAGAPAERFATMAPTFAAMYGAYRIDDRFAAGYVAAGIRRVEAMQREKMATFRRITDYLLSVRDHLTAEQQRRLFGMCAAGIREGYAPSGRGLGRGAGPGPATRP